MASPVAKKAAGTYVPDDRPKQPTWAWMTRELREGSLAPAVKRFCESQPETVDPMLVQIVEISPLRLKCRLPCRMADHESVKTFEAEVLFSLDPLTGAAERV
jgi:hypothetical protein